MLNCFHACGYRLYIAKSWIFFPTDDLKEKLDYHLEKFRGKVKLIRNEKREGLVRARLIGAAHASGTTRLGAAQRALRLGRHYLTGTLPVSLRVNAD